MFIDDYLIDSRGGLKRVLQAPERLAPPVLEGTEPWEGWTAGICGNSVHWDGEDNCFKMWYDTASGVAYATSPDGVHWEKPKLEIVEHKGSRSNNLIGPGRNFSVVKDRREEDPSKRYKARYWHSHRNPAMPWGGKGHFVAFSADGIHWTPVPQNPVINIGNALTDGRFVLGWDSNHGQYIAYMRPHTEFFEPPKRASAWVASDDFMHWGSPVLAIAPDGRDKSHEEFYRMTVTKYQGLYVGFAWVYHNDLDYADQTRDTLLALSRDGIGWDRVSGGEVFLAKGPEGD